MVLCAGYVGRLGAVGLRCVNFHLHLWHVLTSSPVYRASRPVLTPSVRCLSTAGLQVGTTICGNPSFC